MDDIVKAALKKWPNVPACYGWLALDARGDWYMRDDRIQAAGPFPQVKGSRINHDKLKEFIQRNYLADERGAWFFQNGPQRVYLELEAAPLVMRVDKLAGQNGTPEYRVRTHTDCDPGPVDAAWVDEAGRVFLSTPMGLGIVHTLDMEAASDAIEAGLWPLHEVPFADLPQRFAYLLKPAPSA